MTTQKDRRSERRETLAYWEARRADNGAPAGRVSNITPEGLNLHTTHPFLPGDQLRLRILLDRAMAGAEHIDVDIENAWCRPTEDPAVFHAGFKILKISDAARKVVERLLAEFSYPAPEPPHKS